MNKQGTQLEEYFDFEDENLYEAVFDFDDGCVEINVIDSNYSVNNSETE